MAFFKNGMSGKNLKKLRGFSLVSGLVAWRVICKKEWVFSLVSGLVAWEVICKKEEVFY